MVLKKYHAWGIGYYFPQCTDTPNFICAIKQPGLGLTRVIQVGFKSQKCSHVLKPYLFLSSNMMCRAKFTNQNISMDDVKIFDLDP